MDPTVIRTAGLAGLAVIILIGVISAGSGINAEILIMLAVFAVIIMAIAVVKVSTTPVRRILFLVSGVIGIISGLNIAYLSASLGMLRPDLVVSAILITLGIVCISKGLPARNEACDYQIQDERSLRIGTYGLSYSWYLTFLAVAAMGWLAGSGASPISGTQACLILIILMPVSARIFQWYFNTRGDV